MRFDLISLYLWERVGERARSEQFKNITFEVFK